MYNTPKFRTILFVCIRVTRNEPLTFRPIISCLFIFKLLWQYMPILQAFNLTAIVGTLHRISRWSPDFLNLEADPRSSSYCSSFHSIPPSINMLRSLKNGNGSDPGVAVGGRIIPPINIRDVGPIASTIRRSIFRLRSSYWLYNTFPR